ncbi:N-acetylmuramoyl-L-alanine amidase [Novosphingobium sp. NBM11]|uniref:N-acetylmuramoyl-L-alanine amidase family protein n=1 Tax=Novosphingobium sp. NBM11 TaxID=2596914 RepID=UPI000F5DD180|nr:N-acetylmuramoyl-L-alanine amidase [Novosphingobium sp. NBM11]MBF5091642.1 N-acetylmuramoyl-L-alanine amidase [Novosphingobium sp. NBM11]RQW45398.1 N-acetylmuramoyl-L-alanine amidase [Novosphingobium sp. LASN5T]
MLRRVGIIAGFVLPLAALLLWGYFVLRIGNPGDGYVLRLTLPDGSRGIGLPPVEGPADASRPLVVIDAGHGGHDPGASGEGTLREKNVTLALAKALREALLADGRVRVAMTRDSDRFLVLEERAGIARQLKADLFVSIHADAAETPDANGATVYTLSDRGSDAVADLVAQRENRADDVNGVALGGKSNAVATILVDLSRREMRERSQRFSDLVVREGQGVVTFHANPQRQAAFVVLKSLDLPSVLVEAGYISSPDDARRLIDPAWRKQFAGRVAQAVEIFLARQEAAGIAP